MTRSSASAYRRARLTLVSAFSAFAALQLGMSVVMDHWLPVLHDAEYGCKLALLNERRSEHPGSSLTLVLGSSRSGLGIDPAAFPMCRTSEGREVIVFNFAITGCGPVQELQILKRLLRQGVRPEGLLIEIHPLMLHQENGIGEECWIEPRRMDWQDLLLVSDYVFDRRGLIWKWCRTRVAPWYSNRFLILNRMARSWLDPQTQFDPWSGLTVDGWLPYRRETVSAEEYQRGLASAQKEYAPMVAGYRVTEPADRALQTLLALCRDEGIDAALFLMPEASQFRDWYGPAARRELNEYLAKLQRQWQVPVYDDTSWCDDGDFTDGHHLLARGAARFSQRFGREAVAELVARPTRLACRPSADAQ